MRAHAACEAFSNFGDRKRAFTCVRKLPAVQAGGFLGIGNAGTRKSRVDPSSMASSSKFGQDDVNKMVRNFDRRGTVDKL